MGQKVTMAQYMYLRSQEFSSKPLLAFLGSSVMLGFRFFSALLIQLFSTIQFFCIYPLLFLRPFVQFALRYYGEPSLSIHAFVVLSRSSLNVTKQFSSTIMYLSARGYQHCAVVLKLS